MRVSCGLLRGASASGEGVRLRGVVSVGAHGHDF